MKRYSKSPIVCLLFALLLFNQQALACSTTSEQPKTLPDLPPDRLEAYKKAQAIIHQGKYKKGTPGFYQELFDTARHVYIGRISLILEKSDRADESKKDDASYAYVKVSKGWKSGKVRDVRLRVPKQEVLCDPRYSYRLKEKQRYLFFESRKGLITALPIDSKIADNRYAAQAIKYYGQSDWYYSRNTTIHYNSQ